jgi:hypothetical protein
LGDRRRGSIDELLDELAALRNLDRLRQAFPPTSAAHAIAAEQIERRSRALMDDFRALRDDEPRTRPRQAPGRRSSRPRGGVQQAYGGYRPPGA